jgi:hypothetical protein
MFTYPSKKNIPSEIAKKALDKLLDSLDSEQLEVAEQLLASYPRRSGKAVSSSIQDKWNFGQTCEMMVAIILVTKLGYKDIKWSNYKENVMYDIDLFVDDVPVSIKGKTPKYFASDVYLFEIERFSAKDGNWYPSWYYDTRADAFCFLSVHESANVELTWVDRDGVDAYVKDNGFDEKKGLSYSTKREQSAHNQSDTLNGFIKKKNLLSSGVASVLYATI